MGEIEEGFYVAHLDDLELFCYVHSEEGRVFAEAVDGVQWPVLSQPGDWPYILSENLRRTSPNQHIEEALTELKFIYENTSRLLERQDRS